MIAPRQWLRGTLGLARGTDRDTVPAQVPLDEPGDDGDARASPAHAATPSVQIGECRVESRLGAT